MSETVAAEEPGGSQRRVPGTVQLMTSEPIVMPASAAAGQSSLRDHLEERPWLIAVGAVALLALVILVRPRHSD